MPVNITGGNAAKFTAEFFDVNGVLTVPSSATLVVSYTSLTNVSTSSTIGMTAAGSFFTGTWGSSVAAFGNANWSITAPGQSTPATGTLRVLDP